ncbi:hypothetical protein WJX74_000277 [Apatococcus lobatus]|uniref:F-box domain-containing protein n=1 Tax=Apatococcus lobatus TaxID=904363 RepID=A0AAW1SA16_9CHLO
MSLSERTCNRIPRVDTLPDEILLRLFQHLPLKESVTTLPLVCRSFARLSKLPNTRLGDQEFSLTIARLRSADGKALCKWLLPRVTQRLSFDFPADALRLQQDNGCVAELLQLLPVSLQQLTLQNSWADMHYRHSHQYLDFQRCQDLAPHLSALSRLQQLRRLSVPIHAALDRTSLVALSQLQHLHLECRWQPDQPGRGFSMPGVTLSVLSSLASLSMVGSTVDRVTGASALPCLTELVIQQSSSLCLAGAQHCTALGSLRLSCVNLCQSGFAMLPILNSMSALRLLHFDDIILNGDNGDGSLLEIAGLIDLVTLQELQLSQCDGLAYEQQPSMTRAVRPLTRLAFGWRSHDEGLEIPGLSQLTNLQELYLMSGNPSSAFIVPCVLSAMPFLRTIDIVAAETGDGCVQSIDISALALVGPCIERVWIMGAVCVRTACSLLPLAAQPTLKEFYLGSPRQCFMNPEDESWLFCAAFFHALLDRPKQNLSTVSMRPHLGKF